MHDSDASTIASAPSKDAVAGLYHVYNIAGRLLTAESSKLHWDMQDKEVVYGLTGM